MITVDNLVVSYGDNSVLEGLTLALPLSTVNGLVGMNGAGKTTLLNTMAGFLKPVTGTIHIQGRSLQRRDLAFMETDNYFYSNITGREYLGLFKTPPDATDADDWNRLFRLPLDQVIDGYSSGMKRKLALVGVLRQNKPVVILDEPFNGLDLESSRILSLIVLRLKELGKTVLVTSHILGSLTVVCDYIHVLDKGKIVSSRDKEHFMDLEKEIFREADSGYSGLINSILLPEYNKNTKPVPT